MARQEKVAAAKSAHQVVGHRGRRHRLPGEPQHIGLQMAGTLGGGQHPAGDPIFAETGPGQDGIECSAAQHHRLQTAPLALFPVLAAAPSISSPVARQSSSPGGAAAGSDSTPCQRGCRSSSASTTTGPPWPSGRLAPVPSITRDAVAAADHPALAFAIREAEARLPALLVEVVERAAVAVLTGDQLRCGSLAIVFA